MNKNKSLYQSIAITKRVHFHKSCILVLLISVFCKPFVFGQTTDSLQLFRDFVTISNSYKQMPLQMSMEFRQLSNFPLPENEKATMHGEFYLKKEGAYINFGGVEQVVNDSLTLIVMKDIKQMTLSANSTPVSSLLTAMVAQPVQDTSALKFAAIYTVKMNKTSGHTNEIVIASKGLLEGTDLALVGISVLYNDVSKLPEKVITVRRNLVKIPGNDNRDSAYRNELINTPGKRVRLAAKGDFIVKELQAEIVYKNIAHAEHFKLPVAITDRIAKLDDKNFEPVKVYHEYHLSQDIHN